MVLACPDLALVLGNISPRSAWGTTWWQQAGGGDAGEPGALWADPTTAVWADRTPVLRGITWTRGRLSPADRFGAATCSASFTSQDPALNYDMNYPSASRRVRVTIAGKPMFTGTVDDWTVRAVPTRAANDDVPLGTTAVDADTWIEFTSTDGCAMLALAPGLNNPPTEQSGARISRALDTAGWPGPRSLDAGQVGLSRNTRDTQALDEIWLAADSEGGMFYVLEDGTARFADRATIAALANAAPVAKFGDAAYADASVILYTDVTFTRSRAVTVNDVTIDSVSGQSREALDPQSQARHGHRTFQRLDLVHANNADSQTLANTILAARKGDGPFVSFTVCPFDTFPALHLFDVVDVLRLDPVRDVTWTFRGYLDAIVHQVTPQLWTVALGITVLRVFNNA
jgi:hypothetical protein